MRRRKARDIAGRRRFRPGLGDLRLLRWRPRRRQRYYACLRQRPDQIREAFLDAPELSQAFGYRAKQAMSELVLGKDIAVCSHTIDRYGRTVAIVYVDDIEAGLLLLH